MAVNAFKRKLYDKMLAWKREREGRTALLIKGARRVGKSTLAKAFAENEYKSYILIDFLLSRGKKIYPIEVKSSGYNSHKSLDEFCKKFSDRIDRRYLLYTKDLNKDGQTLLLPIYMTPLL